MTKRQKNLIRILSIVVLLIIAAVLVLCSDRFKPGGKTPPVDLSPEHIVSQTPHGTTISPSPDDSSSSGNGEIIGTPIEASDLFDTTGSNPHSSLFGSISSGSRITTTGIQYTNFYNGLTTLNMKDGSLQFNDSGYYTYTDSANIAHTYRIADYVDLSGLFSGKSSAEEGDWFFLGALETPDYIYVYYDFWGADELSLYFRMNRDGQGTILIYAALYNEQSNDGIFTASNETIFYIYTTNDSETGLIESSLMQAETDGSKSGILLSLPDGYTAHHLGLVENAVVFFVTSPEGKTSLLRLDTQNKKLAYISETCKIADYLCIYQHYAITGILSSSLIAYNLQTGEELSIPLPYASSYSLPVCNGIHLFLQPLQWNIASPTTVIPIHPETRTADTAVTLHPSLCYVSGIDDTRLFAESDGTYMTFPIP